MLGPHRTPLVHRLFEALELRHGGQEGPGLAVFQTQQPFAARHFGLKGEPGGDDSAVFAGLVGKLEIVRLNPAEHGIQHVRDTVGVLYRLDVPGKTDEIAPEARRGKHRGRLVGIACGERSLEIRQPSFGLFTRVACRRGGRPFQSLAHRCPPSGRLLA